jgi:hypothetical protein
VTAKFIHISFNFEGREAPLSALAGIFDTALDWARYAPNCWILYTNISIQNWYNRIKKVVHKDDTIFIVEINFNNKQGFLPSDIWDWMNKDRNDTSTS